MEENDLPTLKIWRMHPRAICPRHYTNDAACFDISFFAFDGTEIKGFNANNRPIRRRVTKGQLAIGPAERVMIPTGLIFDIPEGYSVRVHPRSGISINQGLTLINSEGIIDSDFTNEVMVLALNTTDNTITIRLGDRVAQAELIKNLEYKLEESSQRPAQKGNRVGGFGSTGVGTAFIREGSVKLLGAEEKPPVFSIEVEKVDVKVTDPYIKGPEWTSEVPQPLKELKPIQTSKQIERNKANSERMKKRWEDKRKAKEKEGAASS